MPRHKHADLIIAWANGAQIQYRNGWSINGRKDDWHDTQKPDWTADEYRIKPEPKPDEVVYTWIRTIGLSGWSDRPVDGRDNLRLTFDGETGKLKSAEVING